MKTTLKNPSALTIPSRIAQKAIRVAVAVPFLPSARRYDLTISHSYKFIWFRVPKVGTQTILNRLADDKVKLDVDSPYGVHYFPKLYKDYFKFAFVRNPWDRIVSAWHNKVVDRNFYKFDEGLHRDLQSFPNFIDWVESLDIEKADIHLRPQSSMIDLENCDYLGRMETFEQDLEDVFQRLDLPNKSRKIINLTAGRKSYQEYYNDDLMQRVEKIYSKDIQIFGYRY